MSIVRDTTRHARKAYHCDACALWVNAGYEQRDVSADEWLCIEAAKADGWRILRGQKYRHVVYRDGSELRTYRARLGMDDIAQHYELGDEG